ncbi:MAG: S-layer homology domain-containing protein [Chloroflexi bacterium]|nr:S-layer homology domain-containing protein [Chloroflexota bacterium]
MVTSTPRSSRPKLPPLFHLAAVLTLLALTFACVRPAQVESLPVMPTLPGQQDEETPSQGPITSDLYDTGNPGLREVWVDPVHGNDGNDGSTPAAALRTLTAAWEGIPLGVTLTQGVRINLQPGTYTEDMIPLYWSSRRGTFSAPIWIRGNASSRAQVILQASLNIYDTDYLYLENLSVIFGGDVFHCELCDHTLLRNLVLDGGARQAQEVVKVNQSQYFYIENSDIHGAWNVSVDLVAVQHGHMLGNRIHDAGDWCSYFKGGSAYFRVESNTFYDCDNGGFSAGQATGFQFMTAPWIQYEAYDIKVVNNIIHDTDGAGLGVNGGYNILLAYNTLYRVGSQSHVLEVVYGGRICSGAPGDPGRELCQQYLNQGGWGTTEVDNGVNSIHIPDRGVYIYNNIVYNPTGYQSQWMHFAIYDARSNPAFSNVPTAATDTNLRIRGNVIWNGSASMPLGVEDNADACIASDVTCNEAQLLADNAINTVQPAFVNAAGGDFHPDGDWGNSVTLYDIPDYVWEIGSVPSGTISNTVPTDFEGISRSTDNAPGAYSNASNLPHIFQDVPATHWAWQYIERLYNHGVTGGCHTDPLRYCPSASVTRAQMAVFLLKGRHGMDYTPPNATGGVFLDIPATHWAAAWVEQLSTENITGGCGNGNYCPDTTISRDQMAVLLLRAKHGNAFTPLPATGIFADVPIEYWAADWIEQLAAEGITGGCGGGNYCPNLVVRRDQMAVFLVVAFGLP